MNLEANVASPEVASEAPVPMPQGDDKITSIREAARQLSNWRKEKNSQASAEPEEVPAAVEEESPPEGEDAAAEEPPSETQETDAATEELPPVEPPRSWSKEDKETFKGLPRETQERIAERERSREVDFNRRQQDAAEKQKALEAQLSAAEQTRQQYESALPILLQNLQQAQAGEFADIQTMADVEKMAREDWPRYVLWDAQQKKIAAVHQELISSQQRQEAESKQKWHDFAAKEDSLFAEKVPEIADPEKGPKLRDAAIGVLRDLGFSTDELTKAWNGQEKLSLRDHRFQQLLVDAVKYRDAKAKAKTPPKPVPPVQQRPGVSRGPNLEAEAQIKALEQKLDKTGSAKDAARLLMAKRKMAAR